MQEILNIIYTNSLGVQKLLSWISGGTNIFSMRIPYLDMFIVAMIAIIYIAYTLKTVFKKSGNVNFTEFFLKTIVAGIIMYFVIGNPLQKQVEHIEGNAYTHFYFKKVEKIDMETARAFKGSFIIENVPSDDLLFSKAGGMSSVPTVYIDANDVSVKFKKIGDGSSYEYDKGYESVGIDNSTFDASKGDLEFSLPLPKNDKGEIIIDKRAERIKACVVAAVPGVQCTDWGFIFDERTKFVKGFVKLKNEYKQADTVTTEDFGRVSFLNDFEKGFVSSDEIPNAKSIEKYVIDRRDIFYWTAMSVKDVSPGKDGSKIDVSFYIIPNLYTMKLDSFLEQKSGTTPTIPEDGYSDEIYKALSKDYIKEKQRQCNALGKDTCTLADIYAAKARTASIGKVNSYLSAYSIMAGGFSVDYSTGVRRTVTVNGNEYMTFVGLYSFFREKAANFLSFGRNYIGANFASSRNTIAYVTTEDGTEDSSVIRKAYPIGAFQQGSLYSQAYSISSDSGIGITQSIGMLLLGILYIIILLAGSFFPIIIAYAILQ